MFENVGSKIQGLAKIIFFPLCCRWWFRLLVSLAGYAANADYLPCATIHGGSILNELEEAGNAAYTALSVLKVSIFSIILGGISCFPFMDLELLLKTPRNLWLLLKPKQ